MTEKDNAKYAGFKVFYSSAPFFFEVHAPTEEALHRKVSDLDAKFSALELAQ